MLGDQVGDEFFVTGLRVSEKRSESITIPIYIPDWKLIDWLTWARMTGEMLLSMEKHQDFPRNPSGCNSYGQFGMAGFMCDYEYLCNDEDWTQNLSLFKRKPPVPFITEGTVK